MHPGSPWPELGWAAIVAELRSSAGRSPLPSVSEIARERRNPFHVLISTMISLRTKDEVTHAASSRLFALGSSPGEIVGLTEEMISNAIYPAGFYKTKAANIRRVCEIIEREHGGTVPDTIEELVSLPGVGRKTANLVLGLGFGKDAICVDTHVHRIANRGGWVATRSPDETEYALGEILPRKYWIEINELLVSYGQRVCTPLSPHCSSCAFERHCPQIGVTRSR